GGGGGAWEGVGGLEQGGAGLLYDLVRERRGADEREREPAHPRRVLLDEPHERALVPRAKRRDERRLVTAAGSLHEAHLPDLRRSGVTPETRCAGFRTSRPPVFCLLSGNFRGRSRPNGTSVGVTPTAGRRAA